MLSQPWRILSRGMHTFELRPVENGFELRGGQLPEPLVFRDVEPRPAVGLALAPDWTVLRCYSVVALGS